MHARLGADGLRAVGEQWDAFLSSEAAQHVADIFGYPASTITRRNEKDSRMQSYPFADGLAIVRHYWKEYPELHQAVIGYLSHQTETTRSLSVTDRAAATMEQATKALSDLLPYVKHAPISASGQSRTRRTLAECIRAAQKLLNAMDAEAERAQKPA